MPTPIVLVTGVDPDATAAALVALQFDLPDAVAVHHHIDVEREVLVRTVSDLAGLVDRTEIELAHTCVTCAVREDVLPTLLRVAQDGRWRSIVAHLPTSAEADQVCTVIAEHAETRRHLRVASVVVAVGGTDVVDDLLGDSLLAERGLHTSAEDRRGLGEVLCSMVEYADVVVRPRAFDPVATDLLRTLARPDAHVVQGADQLDGRVLLDGLHDHRHTGAWTGPVLLDPLPPLRSPHVWRLDLCSGLAFHPERLLQDLGRLGGGRHRSRGCFWLPTRPGRVLEWAGAGGQLSVGTGAAWGRRTPVTRLVLTGVGTQPAHLTDAFAELLAEPGDHRAEAWQVGEDGFEPWLGPIREAA